MRLRKDAKIEHMRSTALFADCSKRELAELAMVCDEVTVPAGTTLIREGETGRELIVLVDGSAQVTRGGKKVTVLGPGDFAGEIALVSAVPRTATIVAATELRALVLSDQAFRVALRRVPSIQAKVLEALARRLAHDAL